MRHYDKTFDVSRLDGADLLAVYWMGDAIAHVMVSFGFQRRFFLEYIRQINSLRESPEWYNTLTTNCTTNVVRHVRAFGGQAKYNWKVPLSGYAPHYAYELGALDTSLPFEELRRRSFINPKARAVGDDPQFSVNIRQGLPKASG